MRERPDYASRLVSPVGYIIECIECDHRHEAPSIGSPYKCPECNKWLSVTL